MIRQGVQFWHASCVFLTAPFKDFGIRAWGSRFCVVEYRFWVSGLLMKINVRVRGVNPARASMPAPKSVYMRIIVCPKQLNKLQQQIAPETTHSQTHSSFVRIRSFGLQDILVRSPTRKAPLTKDPEFLTHKFGTLEPQF